MDPLLSNFCFLFTLKASHIRENELFFEKTWHVVRLDKIYRLVPQLTLFDPYFLIYGYT
jgi:hypothetical protein